MSADKRKVSTDALETLGTIIGPSEKRDAIHLAVEPVVAACKVKPGDHVGFVNGGVGPCDNPVGIVDPFLEKNVKKGERFWLIVYPRQITSLRHVWTHPAFDEEDVNMKTQASPVLGEAQKRITEIADALGVSYDDLMFNAKVFVNRGEYWNEGDKFDGAYLPDEFWDYYEEVTGEKVNSKWSFLSCAC